jgi:hypothetical protein
MDDQISPPDPDTESATDHASDAPLAPWMCGAKSKRSGKPCRAPAMANGRCHIHGGKSLGGLASPTFKTGAHSRNLAAHLPPNLRARFEAAMADRELLSLRECVALTDLRLQESLDHLNSSDSASFRAHLLQLWEKLEAVNVAKDDPERATKVAATLTEIGKAIRAGAFQVDAFEEMSKAVKERMDATGREIRRLLEMNQIITPEQAMAILIALNAAIQKHVPDSSVRSAIASEFQRIFGHCPRGSVSSPTDSSDPPAELIVDEVPIE